MIAADFQVQTDFPLYTFLHRMNMQESPLLLLQGIREHRKLRRISYHHLIAYRISYNISYYLSLMLPQANYARLPSFKAQVLWKYILWFEQADR